MDKIMWGLWEQSWALGAFSGIGDPVLRPDDMEKKGKICSQMW